VKHVFLLIASSLFRIYLKAVALLAMIILWPANLLLWAWTDGEMSARHPLTRTSSPRSTEWVGADSVDDKTRLESTRPPVVVGFSV
jgi:hypothetical protein